MPSESFTNEPAQTMHAFTKLVEAKAAEFNKLYVGRRVKIVSNYNGQPHGRSKKSLKGTTQVVRHIILSFSGSVYLGIEGYTYTLALNEVIWLNEEGVEIL